MESMSLCQKVCHDVRDYVMKSKFQKVRHAN